MAAVVVAGVGGTGIAGMGVAGAAGRAVGLGRRPQHQAVYKPGNVVYLVTYGVSYGPRHCGANLTTIVIRSVPPASHPQQEKGQQQELERLPGSHPGRSCDWH